MKNELEKSLSVIEKGVIGNGERLAKVEKRLDATDEAVDAQGNQIAALSRFATKTTFVTSMGQKILTTKRRGWLKEPRMQNSQALVNSATFWAWMKTF